VLSTRLGRRRTLLLNAALYVVTALLAALSPSLLPLLLARAAGGVAVGVSTSLTPMYIAECVPPRNMPPKPHVLHAGRELTRRSSAESSSVHGTATNEEAQGGCSRQWSWLQVWRGGE
jgi:MFS family permease